MLYGSLLIILVILSLVILAIIAAQPTPRDDTPAQVRYTQAGKVSDGNGLQKR